MAPSFILGKGRKQEKKQLTLYAEAPVGLPRRHFNSSPERWSAVLESVLSSNA